MGIWNDNWCSGSELRLIDLLIVEGGLIYLDNPVNDGFDAFEDGFSILEVCRNHYRDAGLDVQQLHALTR